MSELFDVVEKRLQKEKDHEETVALWRSIFARYEESGTDGVEQLMDELLIVPEESE
jgi:hypothetical protein